MSRLKKWNAAFESKVINTSLFKYYFNFNKWVAAFVYGFLWYVITYMLIKILNYIVQKTLYGHNTTLLLSLTYQTLVFLPYSLIMMLILTAGNLYISKHSNNIKEQGKLRNIFILAIGVAFLIGVVIL